MKVASKEIVCPECGERDTVEFKAVVAFPVYVAPADGYHYWDFENLDVGHEIGYRCSDCFAEDLEPEDFVVEVSNAE